MGNALFTLDKISEGTNAYDELIRKTRGLVKKWEPTGLLEGLRDDKEVHHMAILLENQARELIDEASQTGGANAESWAGVALPLVRRIFGEIAAKEFVSIQPMNLPSGLVFYLDFRYGSGTQPGFAQNGSVFGGSGGTTNFGRTDAASGGLYGAGKFGYSMNDQIASTSYTNAATAQSASATWKDVNYDPALSASISSGAVKKLVLSASLFTRPDWNGVRAFSISHGTASVLQAYYPAYTKYDSTTKKVTFLISGSAANGGTLTVRYHRQPTDTTRGDFEDTSESGSAVNLDIPEIDIQLQSEPIVAKTRKLKARWTPELAQDLNAYHSIDAETELTAMLSEYIAMEIDLEILDMLISNALTTEYWSARPGWEFNSQTSLFQDNSSHTGTKNEWFQTLGNKIQKVSNKIHQLTLRGGANFLVVSPDVATIIESIPGYAADTNGTAMGTNSFAMGVQKVGMLNQRFTVYKNPYMLENVILVGFRGNNFFETGAVYAPYIPLIMTPLIYDPDNFTPRRGVMTRYAKKLVRSEFYGKIVVKDSEYV